MERRRRPIAIVAFLALAISPGCASRWHGQQPDGGYTSNASSIAGNGGIFQDSVQGLSDASLNDWNFRRMGW